MHNNMFVPLSRVTCLCGKEIGCLNSYCKKFKKEVWITIKSKETSSKLARASYPAMRSLATHSTSCTGWLLFVSVHTNLQDLIPTLAA